MLQLGLRAIMSFFAHSRSYETWTDNRTKRSYQLDHFLTSPSLGRAIVNAKRIKEAAPSDHLPILLKLCFRRHKSLARPRGRKKSPPPQQAIIWDKLKYNSQLRQAFQLTLTELLQETQNESDGPPFLLLQYLKFTLRGAANTYSGRSGNTRIGFMLIFPKSCGILTFGTKHMPNMFGIILTRRKPS